MGIGGEVVRSNATTTKANPPSATAAATNPAKTLLRVLRWGSDLPAEILSHASGETSMCSTRARSVVRTSSSILMVSTPAGAVRSHGSSATSPFLVSTRATWRSARWVSSRNRNTRHARCRGGRAATTSHIAVLFFEPRCVPRSLQSRGESALDREMPQAIPPHVQDRGSQDGFASARGSSSRRAAALTNASCTRSSACPWSSVSNTAIRSNAR